LGTKQSIGQPAAERGCKQRRENVKLSVRRFSGSNTT
jgi:hypothetical protein